MTHIQGSTTTVQVQMSGRTILDALMHKLPDSTDNSFFPSIFSTLVYYRVTLIVPDNGIPIIEYHQANNTKKPKKSIQFTNLLFADKKHDRPEKSAFAIYTIDETVTFVAQDETSMNEWLNKIRECHSNLYPEFKRYDAIFEADLEDKGLANKLNIKGAYRLALCKESLDLIPLLTCQNGTNVQQQHPNQLKPHKTNQKPHTSQSQQTEQSTQAFVNHNNNIEDSTKNNSDSSDTTHVDQPSPQPQHSNHHHNHHHHHHHHHKTDHHHKPHHNPYHHHHHQLAQHLPHQRRFHKDQPLLSARIIELVLRSIRRWGHTDSKFLIESGRLSQIGEGDIWMALSKKAVARQLHELLCARKPTDEEQFFYKPPRSRSGSSSENAYRAQQSSRSSSLVCLAAENPMNAASAAAIAATSSTAASSAPSASFNVSQESEDDYGYLPMA